MRTRVLWALSAIAALSACDTVDPLASAEDSGSRMKYELVSVNRRPLPVPYAADSAMRYVSGSLLLGEREYAFTTEEASGPIGFSGGSGVILIFWTDTGVYSAEGERARFRSLKKAGREFEVLLAPESVKIMGDFIHDEERLPDTLLYRRKR